MDVLVFYLFGFSSFAYVELTTDLPGRIQTSQTGQSYRKCEYPMTLRIIF